MRYFYTCLFSALPEHRYLAHKVFIPLGMMLLVGGCRPPEGSGGNTSAKGPGVHIPMAEYTRSHLSLRFLPPGQDDTAHLQWFYAALAMALREERLHRYPTDTARHHATQAPLDSQDVWSSHYLTRLHWSSRKAEAYPALQLESLAPSDSFFMDKSFWGMMPAFWLRHEAMLEQLGPERRADWRDWLMRFLQYRLHPQGHPELNFVFEREPLLSPRHTLRILDLRIRGRYVLSQQLMYQRAQALQEQLLNAVRKQQIRAFVDPGLEEVIDSAALRERLTLKETARYQPAPDQNPRYVRDTVIAYTYDPSDHPYFLVVESWEEDPEPIALGQPRLHALGMTLQGGEAPLEYQEPLFWVDGRQLEDALEPAEAQWMRSYLAFSLQEELTDELPQQPF